MDEGTVPQRDYVVCTYYSCRVYSCRGSEKTTLTVQLYSCSACERPAIEMDDALNDELELIQAMYTAEDDELCITTTTGATELAVRLQPQTGGARAQRFMEVVLQMQLGAGYPSISPVVRLQRTRGLIEDEESSLLQGVNERAAEMRGEPCLFALVEVVLEKLTELNGGGDCPVCREPLFGGGGGVYLSHCFHSCHAGCLGQWWRCGRRAGPVHVHANPG